MSKPEITDAEVLKLVAEGKSRRWIQRHYSIGSGRFQKLTSGRSEHVPSVEGNAHTYVITCAVNATRAHPGFMKTLALYCAARGAKLLVIPLRYQNPTNRDANRNDEWWDSKLVPYLTSERTKIARNVTVLADIKTQPTAVNPIQKWQTITGSSHAIVGHPRIALKTVATHPGAPAKLVMSTGACTVEQYSDTNAGASGRFHHTLGAVVVEVDGEHSHIRHICPLKDGSFIDLNTKYTRKGIEPAPRAEVLTMGDIHAEKADPAVTRATKELAALIRPKVLVLHDVLNFGSASHHNRFFEKFQRHVQGMTSVLRELEHTAKHTDELANLADKTVMVDSNHNQHFTQWLEKSEHAHDMENALVYHETKAAMLKAIKEKRFIDPFKYWMDKLMKNAGRLHWLKPGESFSRQGIEFGWHGHKGPNGARGSTRGYANIGAKVTKGHSHGAEIIDGAHSVGTSTQMDMGYNVDAPSGWTWTHDITYANGKRTLIHCTGGRFFRADAAMLDSRESA